MAKAPVPGTVKTRLRLELSEAARLQEAMILDAVEKARTIAPVTVAVSPAERLGLVQNLLGPDVSLVAQPGGDLGRRMLAGARGLFEGGEGPVVILGTDAPTLPPVYISDALGSLCGEDAHDAVLVPSEDGGYVLIGLRQPHDDFFGAIAWSTPEVRDQTLAEAGLAGLSVYETPPWYDVDEPGDLDHLRTELSRESGLAPRTARMLAVRDV